MVERLEKAMGHLKGELEKLPKSLSRGSEEVEAAANHVKELGQQLLKKKFISKKIMQQQMIEINQAVSKLNEQMDKIIYFSQKGDLVHGMQIFDSAEKFRKWIHDVLEIDYKEIRSAKKELHDMVKESG